MNEYWDKVKSVEVSKKFRSSIFSNKTQTVIIFEENNDKNKVISWMKKGDFKELNTGISYINSVLLLTLLRP